MRSVEVEGDSIDDAIRKALVELGVARDRAAVEILNDASRGIFGFGGQKARVRATVRAPLSTSLADIEERVAPRVSRETRPAAIPSEAQRATPRPATRSAPESARVSRETRSEPRGSTSNVAASRDTAVPSPAVPPTPTAPPPVAASEAGEIAKRSQQILLELLSHLGVQCQVSCEPGSDGTLVNLVVRGDASALLIGKHGQTLDALEYLLNRIVIREAGSTGRIEVDVEGYRARREQSLVATAKRMAEKVRQTGRPATVDLMNPRDRRIVHMALKDEGGVTSRSQGEGFLRKLIILPAGKRRNGPRQARDGE